MTSSLILPAPSRNGAECGSNSAATPARNRAQRRVTTVILTPLQSWNSTFKIAAEDLPALIGRGDEADIALHDPWVSRRHCEIDVVDGQCIVRDVGSKHGVCVNGRTVQTSPLRSGDSLCVGLQVFDVHVL